MSWIERAQIGDRVVCLRGDGDWRNDRDIGPASYPVADSVYTIARIYPSNGKIYLFLDEISLTQGFNAESFKPAKDTTLQVASIIRAALNIPEHV